VQISRRKPVYLKQKVQNKKIKHFIMARYNHFAKPKNKRIPYSELSTGDEFSFSDKPFRKCVKLNTLNYRTKEGYDKKLHTDKNLMVYVR
jgi:hypothetical protein